MGPEKKSLPVRVLACSYQDGKARYPSEEKHKAPSVAEHRNNLTALSQYRNLLFVAYIDVIYVYTPSFPEQLITTEPKISIDLERSRPGLTGYIDPQWPHAVNHLIVSDIGNEEVLVVACDDGDIISYTVRSISLAIDEGAKRVLGPQRNGDQAIERSRLSGWTNMILPNVDPYSSAGCRVLVAWFHENVGVSAWGLATHKRARLLAVSSNTKNIHVFFPSLSSERHGAFRQTYPYPEQIEGLTAWQNSGPTPLVDRSLDRSIILQGHAANIPSIAFCDNASDPAGKYLVSTDIHGYTIIWDIWRGARIIEISGYHGPQLDTRGWCVACLDPRASRLSEGVVDTFGSASCVTEGDTLIDNSETGDLVQNNSQLHPGFPTSGSAPGTPPTGTVSPALQTAVQAPPAATADQGFSDEDEAEVEGMMDDAMDMINHIVDIFDEDAVDDAEDTALTAYAEASANQPTLQPYETDQHPYLPEVQYSLSDDLLSSETEDSGLPDLEEVLEPHETDQQTVDSTAEEDYTEVLSPALVRERNPWSTVTQPQSPVIAPKLPFNLLQTDQRDIRLFRDITYDPYQRTITTTLSPNIHLSQLVCRQALNQETAPGFANLADVERLNMMAQIPELGIVIIGNQAGRVGVLTMTRSQAQSQSGFKIEAILPFEDEEERGLRPREPLMGMAVGPVQGMERALPGASPRVFGGGRDDGRGARRRFRLLMLYCDHTVLSYEISRPDEGGEDILVV